MSLFAESVLLQAKKKKKGKKGAKKGKKEEEKPVDPNEPAEKPPLVLPTSGAMSLSFLNRAKLDPIQIEPIDLQFLESENDLIKLILESIIGFTQDRIIKKHHECLKDVLIDLVNEVVVEYESGSESDSDRKGKKGAQKEKKKGGSGSGNESDKKEKKGAKKGANKGKGEIILDKDDQNTGYMVPIWVN